MLSRLHNDVTGQDISEQENLACKWRVIGIFSKKYGFWQIMKTLVKQNVRQI